MSPFTCHTVDTAPAQSRRFMTATEQHLGYLPAAMGLLAESPELLEGFLKASDLFDRTTLAPVAREVVVLTIAVRHGCHICVSMHSARLDALGADHEMITALQEGRQLADSELNAVQAFTLAAMDSAGAVPDADLTAFLAAGYTSRNALEVMLGIGTYTMTAFANRLTRAPLDVPYSVGA